MFPLCWRNIQQMTFYFDTLPSPAPAVFSISNSTTIPSKSQIISTGCAVNCQKKTTLKELESISNNFLSDQQTRLKSLTPRNWKLFFIFELGNYLGCLVRVWKFVKSFAAYVSFSIIDRHMASKEYDILLPQFFVFVFLKRVFLSLSLSLPNHF